MSASLFRDEAIAAQSTQWLGTIRVAQPIGHAVAAAFGLAVIAAIVAFATLGTYTRRATVAGSLQPVGGSLRLTSPGAGLVTAARVREGERVAAGQTLFVLSGERQSSSGATQAAIATQLAARRASLERDLRLSAERRDARDRTTRSRLDAIDIESAQLAHEADINAARQAIAEQNVARFDALARTGFIAPAQAQARLDEALVLRAQRENYKRIAAGLQRERIGLASQIDDSRLQADAERTDVARALAAIDQEAAENEAHRSTVVSAPYAATITGIAARPGQWLGAGALLATLIPDGAPLQAELFASTRQIGFVARGQPVHLRYAAYPYQKFGIGLAVVDTIEQSPYAMQELPPQVIGSLAASSAGGEPVYRIVAVLDRQTIETYGLPQRLKAGMQFEADVVQDRRRLYEWLLEPVYGLVGRS